MLFKFVGYCSNILVLVLIVPFEFDQVMPFKCFKHSLIEKEKTNQSTTLTLSMQPTEQDWRPEPEWWRHNHQLDRHRWHRDVGAGGDQQHHGRPFVHDVCHLGAGQGAADCSQALADEGPEDSGRAHAQHWGPSTSG